MLSVAGQLSSPVFASGQIDNQSYFAFNSISIVTSALFRGLNSRTLYKSCVPFHISPLHRWRCGNTGNRAETASCLPFRPLYCFVVFPATWSNLFSYGFYFIVVILRTVLAKCLLMWLLKLLSTKEKMKQNKKLRVRQAEKRVHPPLIKRNKNQTYVGVLS